MDPQAASMAGTPRVGRGDPTITGTVAPSIGTPPRRRGELAVASHVKLAGRNTRSGREDAVLLLTVARRAGTPPQRQG